MSRSAERLVEELWRRHHHIAVLAAHDLLRDWALAEDAAQLGFLLILNRLRRGDAGLLDRPEATVRRNARWAAMKIRAARLHSETAEDRYGRGTPADDAGAWSSAEARLVCERILGSLPEHYREAIQLRFFRQLPDAVAAARLQVTLRAYRRRLDRAVALARSLAGDIGLQGAAGLLSVVQGVRGLRERLRRLAGLGDAWGTPVATTTALVVIAVSPSGPVLGVGVMPAVVPSPGWASTPRAVAVAAVSIAKGDADRAVPVLPASTPGAVAPERGGDRRMTAADETPEDTTLYSAAAAPNGEGSGSVVAVGWGHGCACTVVFESRDGWHSWRAAAGPDAPAVNAQTRVALPPAYPDDPRIFLGSPAISTVPDMWASQFGAAFSALPITGYITAPPSFEQDSTLLVAVTGGMERFSLTGFSSAADHTRPVLFVPPAMADVVTAAAAPRSAVTFALTGAASRSAYLAAPGVGAYDVDSTGGVPTLYSCVPDGHCTRVGASPASLVAGLTVSLDYAAAHAIAVLGTQHDIHLSTDSGQTFTTLPDPGGAVRSVSLTSVGGGAVVWAAVARSGAWSMMRWDAVGGWRVMSPAWWHPSGAAAGLVAVLLGADRVVVFHDGAPALCTADGGQTWAAVCPS